MKAKGWSKEQCNETFEERMKADSTTACFEVFEQCVLAVVGHFDLGII